MLHISKIFFKIWFPNNVSQSHVIYHFGNIIWEKKKLEEKFEKSSISQGGRCNPAICLVSTCFCFLENILYNGKVFILFLI
jgi:hypothetical protein